MKLKESNASPQLAAPKLVFSSANERLDTPRKYLEKWVIMDYKFLEKQQTSTIDRLA